MEAWWARYHISELPSCPSYLYTSSPVFPFAPVITDEAALLRTAPSSQSPSAPLAATTPPPQAAASRIALALQSDCLDVSEAVLEDVCIIIDACSAPDGATQLQAATLYTVSDTVLLTLISRLISTSASYARAYNCAHYLLLPCLKSLAVPSSRDLAAAVQHMVNFQPQAFLDGCMAPLLATVSTNKPQAELMVQALKQTPSGLLPKLITAAYGSQGSPATPSWTEYTVTVAQAVVDRKPQLQAAELECLIAAAAHAAEGASKQVKFSKLVLSIIKTYEGQLGGVLLVQLRGVVDKIDTFMKKSLVVALNTISS